MSVRTAPASPAAIDAVLAELSSSFGDRITTNRSIRDTHAAGEGFHAPRLPDAVAFPLSTEDVALIVKVCARQDVPVIAYGAGTSLEGGVTAPYGGVCIDLSRMSAILAVNAADLDCSVQAGVTREDLNAYLRDTGLYFPIDPGANATLGGMCATRASGTTAVRYGTMKDNVLSLEVVLADGSIIRTGGRARKSAAGYDLTRLFIGSEGTLGIITAITIKLYGRPEAEAAAVCAFETLAGAVDCVIDVLQLGIPVARIELMDAAQVRACNAYSGADLQPAPTLLFEFQGSETAVREQAETVGELSAAHGGGAFAWASEVEQRTALWRARHAAYHAAQALRPGSLLLVTDVCVPISRLADCILQTHCDIEAAGVVATIVGHVGDGNFHVMFPLDPQSDVEIDQVHRLNDALVDRALQMEGTCTGEHGIGVGKREKLVKELGPGPVALMAAIKTSMDPADIFNPGKIFLPPLIQAG